MMTATESIDIRGVTLGILKRYLRASGWESRQPSRGLELYIYKMADSEEIEIILPVLAGEKDTNLRMIYAVQTLISLQKRSPSDVLTEVRAIGFDIVRSRLPDTGVRRDSIKLSTATSFISRLSGLLAASAHAELHTGPYYQRLDSQAALYADSCRFGHTFRGSFGFTIESPVGPRTGSPIDPLPMPPLERRVVQRFVRGLMLVQRAVVRENPEEIAAAYTIGLNANACDHLATLISSSGNSSVEFEIVFSPEWGAPADVGPNPTISINQPQAIEIISEASKILRRIEFDPSRTIRGKVIRLISKDNPSDLFNPGARTVSIIWDSREFGSINVSVDLEPGDYLRALEAHRSGRIVQVSGLLKKRGSRFSLENPSEFFVTDEVAD